MDGTCDPRFAGVRDALEANDELGAAVAVIVDGVVVADLWTGWADEARTTPWRRDTVVNVWSVGKAIAGLCLLRLADQGHVQLDAPATQLWPELHAATAGATVADVLAHRSGLAAIAEPLPDGAVYDWPAIIAALERQEPWWPPGTDHGYHVHTYGFLVGELVRRGTGGETIGAYLRREIAGPLGADVGFGLPPADRARRAEYVFAPEMAARARHPPTGGPEHDRLRRAAYLNPPGAATGVNTTAWLDAEIPSANGHATARGVATIYHALIKDDNLLGAETRARATTAHADGVDRVLRRPSRFGLGFQLTQPERPLGPNATAFGHFGAGGSLGFADPTANVAFAYIMNRGGAQWQDPRNRALIDAVYAAL